MYTCFIYYAKFKQDKFHICVRSMLAHRVRTLQLVSGQFQKNEGIYYYKFIDSKLM
jgi:hypothetical protein